jgi:hypothetical protein
VTSYEGRRGVWAVWENEEDGDVLFISEKPVEAILELAKMGSGTILFWPFGLRLEEAIDWWTEVVFDGAEVVPFPTLTIVDD